MEASKGGMMEASKGGMMEASEGGMMEASEGGMMEASKGLLSDAGRAAGRIGPTMPRCIPTPLPFSLPAFTPPQLFL